MRKYIPNKPLLILMILTMSLIAAMAHAQTTPTESGYLQIDNLTITGIVSPYAPTQMLAADLSYPTMSEDGTAMVTTTPEVTCVQFANGSSSIGTSTTCPVPPIAPTLTTSTSSTTASSSTYYSPYTIQIDPTTQVLLNDNSPTLLGNFAPGDIVDVYGYYNNTDESIDAQTVRDLSKPIVGTPTTTDVGAGLTATSTALAIATTPEALGELQSYISEVATLIAQLQSELSAGVVTTPGTVSSTALPMIPATIY